MTVIDDTSYAKAKGKTKGDTFIDQGPCTIKLLRP